MNNEATIELNVELPPQAVVLSAAIANKFGHISIFSRSCKVRNHEEIREQVAEFQAEIIKDGYEIKSMVVTHVPDLPNLERLNYLRRRLSAVTAERDEAMSVLRDLEYLNDRRIDAILAKHDSAVDTCHQ